MLLKEHIKATNFRELANQYNEYFKELGENIRVEPYCAYGKYSFFVYIDDRQIHTTMTTRGQALEEIFNIYSVIRAMRV
jgi:hypothetical protein